jgi:ABC-type transport system substrate-binding protein
MKKPITNSLLLLIPLIILFYGCGSSDTITVVDRGPESASGESSERPDQPNGDDFTQLRVGILEPVTNFDPLYAVNLSTLRVISLIYDGLFKLDNDGNPEPALINDYTVSDDGTQYEFKLNRDLYFHDSTVFGAGVGRRIHAEDVRWVFERTAKVDVPPTASRLLMNIVGYNNYFTEQRTVFDSSKRVLDGISGIEVINAETIRFTLKNPDEDFLKKLGSPYLSIYPSEALQNRDDDLRTSPVGTGAYILNSQNENEIVLTRNPSPRFTDRQVDYPVNRIDFIYQSSEADAFQQFARKNIDWVPELGPQIKTQVTDSSQNLVSSYQDQFELVQNSATRFTMIYLNESSERDLDYVKYRLVQLEQDQLTSPGNISFEEPEIPTEYEPGSVPSDLYVTYTDNPFATMLFTDINNSVFRPETSLSFLDIRIPTAESVLFSRSVDSFHYPFFNTDNFEGHWLTAESVIIGIYHSYIDGIEPTAVPWHLPLRGLEIDQAERDAS